MRPIFIFGGFILVLALASLCFITEINTGFATRAWHNWLFVREASIQGDTPWIASGKTATFYIKYDYRPDSGLIKVFEWGAGPRDTTTVQETIDEIFSYLDSISARQSWPLVKGERIAPCRFWIVSLDPVIVLMQSYLEPATLHVGTISGGSVPAPETASTWARGSLPLSGPKAYSQSFYNAVHYGTQLPPAQSWKWFSPNLHQPPVPLVMADGKPAPIRWKTGQLIFSPKNKGWSVERQDP